MLVALALLILVVASFMDAPLKRYAERQLNSRLEGYQVTIGKFDSHPLNFSLDLEDLTVIQEANPETPLAVIAKWSMSLQWKELLRGNIVSNHVIERPTLHLTRPQAKKEAKDGTPIQERGWQEAVLAVYPFTLNEFKIKDGDITYLEQTGGKPIHVRHLQFKAENIRNTRSKEREYPSPLQVEADILDGGRLRVAGAADLLADPYMAFNVDIALEQIPLGNLLPLVGPYNVYVRQGTLDATGHVEYAPWTQVVLLNDLTIRGAHVDYVHSRSTADQEKARVAKARDAAKEASQKPGLQLRIERGNIENSEFGFVNQAAEPPYRVFLADTDIYMENLSNKPENGTGQLKLRGLFMGQGAAVLTGLFRPETKAPDFDLNIQIVKTPLKSMNNLLRAHGKFDVSAGEFSLYTELHVKNGQVKGYVKPLFQNVNAYDSKQDRNKGVFQKLYEGVVEGVTELLENTPRDEVATKADISGTLDHPQPNTWSAAVNLIQNAFFEAILPGYERQFRTAKVR